MLEMLERTPQVTPFLCFNSEAEEAVEFYLSVFKDGKRVDAVRSNGDGPWQKGAVVSVPFEIAGRQYVAFNGGPVYKFTEAISMWVQCVTQEEIDYYWSALSADGGHPGQCGWLKDKFGLSWQVVPAKIVDLIKSGAAMQALMSMTKLDLAVLEAAARE